MATREVVQVYSQYVIGKVESNHNWASCPAFDGVSSIITLGMMQMAGSNAQALLLLLHANCPDVWATIEAGAPRVAGDVLTLPQTWTAWQNYALGDAEREIISAAIATDCGKGQQQAQWNARANDYIDYAITLGFSLAYPRPLIYFMSMYHQHQLAANGIAAQVGGNADLALIHSARANNSILGNSLYNNRYTTIYQMLIDWDAVSMPPDFGQVTAPSTGGQPPGLSQTTSTISRVELRNGEIVIWGTGGYANGLYCKKSAPNIWIPSSNVDGAPIEGGHVGGGDNPQASAILQWLRDRLGQWYYSQAAGRDNSDVTGYADCSSTWWQAFWHVAGIDVGGYTGAMIERGSEVIPVTTNAAIITDAIAAGTIQDCDLILWGETPAFGAGNAAHVVGYSGGGRVIETGGGGTTHPTELAWSDCGMPYYGYGYYTVRRYL